MTEAAAPGSEAAVGFHGVRRKHTRETFVMVTKTETTVDTLNSLLRGELSACETYHQAIGKFGSEPGAADLLLMHQQHVQAANELREHVRQFGGEPDHSSGSWGSFAKAVEGVAKLFGCTAALKALKEGEEHGISSYESALKEAGLPEQCQGMIGGRLLPQTRSHVTSLERLMSAK
jgi:bacterioferritin (cytochrome b1)